jgi:hypothetical protein
LTIKFHLLATIAGCLYHFRTASDLRRFQSFIYFTPPNSCIVGTENFSDQLPVPNLGVFFLRKRPEIMLVISGHQCVMVFRTNSEKLGNTSIWLDPALPGEFKAGALQDL